jgi:hypothetical protein
VISIATPIESDFLFTSPASAYNDFVVARLIERQKEEIQKKVLCGARLKKRLREILEKLVRKRSLVRDKRLDSEPEQS